jgi:flagellar M-ring protein FliF
LLTTDGYPDRVPARTAQRIEDIVSQLQNFWMALAPRKKGALVGGIAALIACVLILSRVATTPSYVLLYAGLDPSAAGEVIAALEQRGVMHDVRGDAIYVDQSDRDQLRMSLAAENLPANGPAGYELLDGLSGFGTTSQMFDAAYWRAKEGELARTIVASPLINAARVHLATPTNDPFQSRSTVTGSVSVRPAGGALSESHARSLRFLVASAVSGLSAEDVVVIDADSGQVLSDAASQSVSSDAQSRALVLRQNIERLLGARVGPQNAVVEVSVELITARETIVEHQIDPSSRVVISTDNEERSDTSQDAGAGGVSVASNLPDGDGAGDTGSTSSSQNSQTRERVNYEVSETQREIEQMPGGIRRLGVAVLVNAVTRIGDDGIAVTEPRAAEELEALRGLVQSAIGFDTARGDQITIHSMQFEVAETLPLVSQTAGLFNGIDVGRLVQVVVLGVVTLVLGLFVIRPIAVAGFHSEPTGFLPRTATSGQLALADAGPGGRSATPSTANSATGPAAAATDSSLSGEAILPSLQTTGAIELAGPNPVDRLRSLIQEREVETVEILRSWMEEGEEPTI